MKAILIEYITIERNQHMLSIPPILLSHKRAELGAGP